eukprot:Pgem_evm1s9344
MKYSSFSKAFSPACEKNKVPILQVLNKYCNCNNAVSIHASKNNGIKNVDNEENIVVPKHIFEIGS